MKILINNEEEFKLVLKKLGATYHTNRKSIKDLTVTNSSKLINKIKEELMSMKQFTKRDLKNGMVVKVELGDNYMVVNNRLINQHGFNMLDSYAENLTIEDRDVANFDIIEVFNFYGYDLDIDNSDYLTSIWKRPNPRINELKTEISQLHKLTTELSDLEAK